MHRPCRGHDSPRESVRLRQRQSSSWLPMGSRQAKSRESAPLAEKLSLNYTAAGPASRKMPINGHSKCVKGAGTYRAQPRTGRKLPQTRQKTWTRHCAPMGLMLNRPATGVTIAAPAPMGFCPRSIKENGSGRQQGGDPERITIPLCFPA